MEETEAKEIGFSRSFVSTNQASLGGRVRLLLTGAAPISAPILTFFRAALGCQVSQAASLKIAYFTFAHVKLSVEVKIEKLKSTKEKVTPNLKIKRKKLSSHLFMHLCTETFT